MRILLMTTEWPSEAHPTDVPFMVDHVQALRRQGVQVDVFHFSGRRNPLRYLKAWWDIRQLPAWKEAQLLHAHWGQSALLALGSGKPWVVTFHGSDLQGIVDAKGKYSTAGRILINFSRWVSARADHCIVVSDHLRKLLSQKAQKVTVLPVGIDLEQFVPIDQVICRQQLGLDRQVRIVLFVSDPQRLEKRFWMADEAVKWLKNKHPDWKIQLFVVNGVPHEQIPAYLNAGDVLLLTSSHEGSPTVVKEALACRLPVVSLDVGDVRERLEGITGCVVCEEHSVDALVQGLEGVLAKPARLTSVRNLEAVDENTRVAELIQIYRSVVEKQIA